MRIPGSAVQAVTIRGDLLALGATVASGTGTEGDIVLARVTEPGGVAALTDWRRQQHPVRKDMLMLGVLANRDSTTHASGIVPPSGIRIERGTSLAWLGGQSGLLGIETWTPSPGNPAGAQASARVHALGLVTAAGRPVNIARFSREPGVKTTAAPVIVVCGTAAEVGKTTLASRIIRYLARPARRSVTAIKPTGSGGITDSLAHQQAGAAATYDIVDCGLPSSYTSPERFASRAGRCLLYAEDHHPDLVVCELGGDLTWGNNDTFLRLPELRGRVAGTLCIAGDAAGALGTMAYLERVGLARLPVTYAPAWTRNPRTFQDRLACLAPAVRVLPDTSDQALTSWLSTVVPTALMGTRSAAREERP